MFGRKINLEVPAKIDGLPVYTGTEPYVLSNRKEERRLARETGSTIIRVCKFGIRGRKTSAPDFAHIRDLIEYVEDEFVTLSNDTNTEIPEHEWGLIPKDKATIRKIRFGNRIWTERYHDEELLPSGFLLACQVVRVEPIMRYEPNLRREKPGYASPEVHDEFWDSLTQHVVAYERDHPYYLADLSPSQFCYGTPAGQDIDPSVILLDIEPIIRQSQVRT